MPAAVNAAQPANNAIDEGMFANKQMVIFECTETLSPVPEKEEMPPESEDAWLAFQEREEEKQWFDQYYHAQLCPESKKLLTCCPGTVRDHLASVPELIKPEPLRASQPASQEL